jgi:hypothetical protein
MSEEFLFGLTGGEAFVVGFITFAVVSAPWWPRLGARLVGGPERPPTSNDPDDPTK